MQVLCKACNTVSDIRCQVCGQGFLVYWTRSAPEERARWREEIVRALRGHHTADQTTKAHPQSGFNLPEWGGKARHSAAALLGNAPEWAVA